MRIKGFAASRAHGYLNLAVAFNDPLTLITGKNGSGKTTVVRGVVSLLTPSFRALAGTQYDRYSVEIEHDGIEHQISSVRTEAEFTITVRGIDDTLTMPIYRQAEYDPPSRFAEREAEFYREQHTINAKHPVLAFLNNLPTPMFLDLERRGQDPPRRPRFISQRDPYRISRNPFLGTLGESLLEAQELAEDAYRQFLAAQQELMENLRKNLILTAFTSTAHAADEPVELPPQDYLAKLAEQRELVSTTLKALGIPEQDVQRRVESFFELLHRIATDLLGRDLDILLNSKDPNDFEVLRRWIAIHPQEQQISRIVKLVERFNSTVQEKYAPIGRYLGSVTRFLRDSGKHVEFTRRGRLSVAVGASAPGSMSALSSGERQLVVILTHLAFNPQARQANVLIIDEPELSLHVRWQEQFVDTVLGATEGLQLILATHSPSIILDRTAECVDLGVSGE